jgi:hypothetical protein
MENELVIDSNNFEKYFRDCRISRPERGDVMARYSAIAEFVDGKMKQDIIHLLTYHDNKAIAATNVMRKLGCATESDAIRICKEITEDLANGMTEKEVEDKVYRYKMEVFYYTKKDYVPDDDPHWSIISIANLDKFLDSANQLVSIKSKIVESECSHEKQEVQTQSG